MSCVHLQPLPVHPSQRTGTEKYRMELKSKEKPRDKVFYEIQYDSQKLISL